jgi:hypothetical protein
MGSDMVVVTVGTSASCNILQHPSASLIGIHHKHQGSSGICRIGIRIKVRSSRSNEACLCIADIIRMLEISNHQTDGVHTNQHIWQDSCQFWSFEENPRCYLIILDSIYTIPLDVFSSFLSTFIFPEILGLTPTRTLITARQSSN